MVAIVDSNSLFLAACNLGSLGDWVKCLSTGVIGLVLFILFWGSPFTIMIFWDSKLTDYGNNVQHTLVFVVLLLNVLN